MSTPSALVADRYRLVKMLGAGGMGVVWQAWDTRLRRPVALKMLRTQPELTDAERQVATDRAMREAQITAGLHHAHAVTVFDVVEHDGQPCIVMQLIESTTLSELLKEHGSFTPAETARIGQQVASALAAAHALKIVHRDVKPGNILIAGDGSALISDFGISHALGDATITATGMIHGTPASLAPEVARGLPTSFASDVYSLGSTLYALLEGEPPFGTGKNAIALLHRVAKGGHTAPQHAGSLAPLLETMLASDPKRRPTMASVADALRNAADAEAGAPDAAAGLVALGFDPASVGDGPESMADSQEPADPGATEPYDVDAATEDIGATTVAFDQPPRPQAPTAETERLGEPESPAAGGSSVSLPAWVAQDPPAEASAPPRRRRGWLAAVILIVVALGVGAALLLNALQGPAPEEAAPTPAQTSEAGEAQETPGPEPAAPAPAPSSAEPESTPAPTPTPTAATAEQRVTEAIAGYYALMPAARDEAWPLMTADYQENHAGGRGGYEAFWSTISDVSVSDVSATGPDSGQATLTYHFADGRVVEEVTAYRLVDEGGILKIAATDVLSSREL
ncbi:serine/threonine-protein kinase [Microbacterium sp. E-13]|uniref:serine/threonine-protein kinase n=1 Tax=Microbacterium sp. E-13 TaxID=3404048 RepID=UPI003CE8F03B